MPLFTVSPDDGRNTPRDFVAGDPGQLLAIIHRIGWKSAHIAQDGQHLFSVSLSREGVWTLTNSIKLGPILRLVG